MFQYDFWSIVSLDIYKEFTFIVPKAEIKSGQGLSLKSLVTIRMNEIFPCLTCYGQKLNFYVRKSRQR